MSPSRVYAPQYMGNTYGPYTNPSRAAMDGWVGSGSVSTALERGWSVLRESFAVVYADGEVTMVDPVAAESPSLGLRMCVVLVVLSLVFCHHG